MDTMINLSYGLGSDIHRTLRRLLENGSPFIHLSFRDRDNKERRRHVAKTYDRLRYVREKCVETIETIDRLLPVFADYGREIRRELRTSQEKQ